MDIPQIANLSTAIEMKREILKLVLEKNLPEERIWEELEIYHKTHPDGRSDRKPTSISSILKNIFSKTGITITESPMEDLLKHKLEAKDIKFQTQKKIGKCRVDFFFPQASLIVEVDRREYHSTSEQREKDMKRQMNLMKRGYAVLRFRGSEIYRDAEGCAIRISEFLASGG